MTGQGKIPPAPRTLEAMDEERRKAWSMYYAEKDRADEAERQWQLWHRTAEELESLCDEAQAAATSITGEAGEWLMVAEALYVTWRAHRMLEREGTRCSLSIVSPTLLDLPRLGQLFGDPILADEVIEFAVEILETRDRRKAARTES